MSKIGEKNIECVSWEIATTQARLAKRRESIKSLIIYQRKDQQRLEELMDRAR